MKLTTTHKDQIVFLRKIEGQIRGIQKMIDEGRYCVDIITQLHSVVGAILRIEENVFHKHIEGCVISTLKGNSKVEKQKKINELLGLISKFRRL